MKENDLIDRRKETFVTNTYAKHNVERKKQSRQLAKLLNLLDDNNFPFNKFKRKCLTEHWSYIDRRNLFKILFNVLYRSFILIDLQRSHEMFQIGFIHTRFILVCSKLE